MSPLIAVYIAVVVATVAGLGWMLAAHTLAWRYHRRLAAHDAEMEGGL